MASGIGYEVTGPTLAAGWKVHEVITVSHWNGLDGIAVPWA